MPSPGRRIPATSVAAITALVVALVWRVGAGARSADLGWFLLLVAAEAFGTVRAVLELVLVGPRTRRSRAEDPRPAGVAVPDVDALVIVDDEPILVVRAAVLAARQAGHVRSVSVIDRNGRVAVAALARRLGVACMVPPAADAGQWSAPVPFPAPGPVPVLVVPADHVLRPDAVADLAAGLGPGVAMVSGRCETVNASRRIDLPELGRARWWSELVVARLSEAGALRTGEGVVLLAPRADGQDELEAEGAAQVGGLDPTGGVAHITPTVSAIVGDARRSVAVAAIVARVLAPSTRREARHLAARAAEARRRVAALPTHGRRRSLDAPARVAVRLVPWVVVQRVTLLGIAIATLLGGARPVAGPVAVAVAYGVVRLAVLCGARRAVEGRRFGPWLLDDWRAAPQDLAVAWRARGADRPARRTGRAAGDGVLRGLPRLVDVVVAGSIAAAVTGFVHVHAGALPVAACVVCLAHLGASNLARRELRRIQFRSWWRADVELPIEGSPDRRVIGLSPHGFDVVGPAPFVVGDEVVARVALPGAATEEPGGVVVDLVGRVQRAAVVPEGGAAYVRFDGLDATVEDAVLVFLGAGACTAWWHGTAGPAAIGAVRPISRRA